MAGAYIFMRQQNRAMKQNATSGRISDEAYTSYGVVMTVVTTLGLLGNVTIVVILVQVEHRTKMISYLMLNIAVASIIICGFWYPVAMSYNLKDFKTTTKEDFRCSWVGFLDATSCIACILTLALMSVTQYRGITQLAVPSSKLSISQKKRLVLLLIGIWVSAIVLSVPPMFGWNKFVPVQSGVSCHPDWASQDPKDKAYIWFLVTGGFFIPLTVICVFYGMTYRFMQRLSFGQIGDIARKRRLAQQKKLTRMITAAILAVLLSWSPYCLVSLISSFKGRNVISPGQSLLPELISPGQSLVPELMAKASVIYNPIIFNCFSTKIRATLVTIITSCSNRILSLSSRRGSKELEAAWGPPSLKHNHSLPCYRKNPGFAAEFEGEK